MNNRVKKEWGGTNEGGWRAVPLVFLQNLGKFSLTPSEVTFIITIHSLVKGEQKIFPKVKTIAGMMGVSDVTVRTYIRNLRRKKYLKTHKQKFTQIYDFSGLYEKIRQVEEEIAAKEDKSRPFKVEEGDSSKSKGAKGRDSSRCIESNKIDSYPEEKVENNKINFAAHASEPPEEDTFALAPKGNLSPLGIEIEKAKSKVKEKRKNLRVGKGSNINPFKSSRQVKLKKPNGKPLDEYNCNDVGAMMQRDVKDKFGYRLSTLTMKDRKLLKTMIAEYGAEEVVVAAHEMIDRWEEFTTLVNLQGYPSISILWGYRDTIIPWSTEGVRKDHRYGYYEGFDPADKPKDGEIVGWGEDFMNLFKEEG